MDKYEKDDEEGKEEKDKFFVSCGYPSDEEEEEDKDEEVEDNYDDPGESKACLDVELAKSPRSLVTKLPRRVVAKLLGNAKKEMKIKKKSEPKLRRLPRRGGPQPSWLEAKKNHGPKETCRQVPKQVYNQVPRESCR